MFDIGEYMSYNTEMDMTEQTAELIGRSLKCNFTGAWMLNVSNSHFPGWWGSSTPIISLMLHGEIETMIRGDENNPLRWREGDVFCLLPSMQRFHRIVSGGNVRYCGVGATFEILNNGLDLLSFFKLPVIYSGAQANRIGNTLKKFISAGKITVPFKRSINQNALCAELLLSLLEQAELRVDAVQRINGLDRLSNALNHLIMNDTEEPDIALLAKLTSLSTSRFHAVFKKTIGYAPYEFIKRRRLDKATTMLASSDLSVSEIGQSLGWNDQFHFSRTFKGFFGVSPRRYRENIKAGIHTP